MGVDDFTSSSKEVRNQIQQACQGLIAVKHSFGAANARCKGTHQAKLTTIGSVCPVPFRLAIFLTILGVRLLRRDLQEELPAQLGASNI
jgi:hypothetical protein